MCNLHRAAALPWVPGTESWSAVEVAGRPVQDLRTTDVKMRQKRREDADPPAVLRPSSSEMENVSRRLAAPHCHTNSGDTSVMKAAETNLLLMVSG